MNTKRMNFYIIIVVFFSLLTIQISCSQPKKEVEKDSQGVTILSDYVRSFLAVETQKIALANCTILDGAGSPPKYHQTILIENEKIKTIGDSLVVEIPDDFYVIDLSGKTVIPGIVGTHNHMRLPQGAMLYTSPKLYLACGVTTIQTCGTGNPSEEIAIAKAIDEGRLPGPEIVNSSPYFTGPEGKANFIQFTEEKKVRDTIRFWANKGVKWFKVYRHTRPQDLKVIIDEAHKHGAKVTGHLCATTYQEAAALGIDAIEHGFLHSYDHAEGKEPGVCSGNRDFRSTLDIQSEEVKQIHRALIENNVALSTTLAIFETQARGSADQKTLQAMSPYHVNAYHDRRKRMEEKGDNWYFKEEWLLKAMQYDLAFFRSGGLLTAGPDPGLHNLPGYGDQKNYELLIEAGFKPEEAIQVMTSNGAKLLGRTDIGKIQPGMLANVVVLAGDLTSDPAVIKNVNIVFKQGRGYSPEKLIESIQGHVGSGIDDYMTYLGQKEPDSIPQVFAPDIISKSDRHEFGSVFSKKGDEVFFGVDRAGRSEILYSTLTDGVWSNPEVLLSDSIYSFNDPMLSSDEKRLYFISDMPQKEANGEKNTDIWYIERTEKKWSDPIHAGNAINTDKNEYYISFTDSGAMYFASNSETDEDNSYNFDIYRSELANGKFQRPVKLPGTVNSDGYEADVFVAPDESYMVFCSIREDGSGMGDLYISFKDNKGNWMPAKNMGKLINTPNHELCPFVSGDGKYLFYTSDQDIYWVSAEIINRYR